MTRMTYGQGRAGVWLYPKGIIWPLLSVNINYLKGWIYSFCIFVLRNVTAHHMEIDESYRHPLYDPIVY